MSEKVQRCQFSYLDLYAASSPVRAFYLRLVLYSLRKRIKEGESAARLIKTVLQFAGSKALSAVHPQGANLGKKRASQPYRTLHLKPGEIVEVLTEEEILATLDDKGKLRGLEFIPEMRKFCGKKFRVYKRLENIILEATGQFRKIKDTVLLEEVICDGSAHFNCDRSCFCFWREAWLKRVTPNNAATD